MSVDDESSQRGPVFVVEGTTQAFGDWFHDGEADELVRKLQIPRSTVSSWKRSSPPTSWRPEETTIRSSFKMKSQNSVVGLVS